MEDKLLIVNRFKGCGIEISDEQTERFFKFYRMVIEKNEIMNLTAITDYEDFIIKHFLDSAMIGRVISFKGNERVLDIGTGAGFPGIPVKILYPDTDILLLDSLNKRLKFLDEVIEKLELKDIKTIHSRAEELQAKGDYRESFDICVSRAVSALPTLCEYCMPYVKEGGNFVAYKAVNADEEIKEAENAIKVLGGKIEKIDRFVIAGSDYERVLISIKKVKSTPKKYPRSGGKPQKMPLK